MIPRLPSPFRSAVVAAAVWLSGAGCGATAPAPADGGPGRVPRVPPASADPKLAALPEPARALVHATTGQLPAFPHENPAALNPASWVSSVGDSGRVCVLELRTYVRGTPVTLGSIRERRPGQSLSARYLCGSRGWRGPRYAGPFYVWDGSDGLVERSYRETDGTRYREDLYQYRGNGLVWAYRQRERNEDQTGPALQQDELFDPDGKLAGFAIERSAPDSLAIWWRRGSVVSEEVFRKWAAEFK